MSILSTTHSGAKYTKFCERLDAFTKFALNVNKIYWKNTFDTSTISFYLPLRRLEPENLVDDFRKTHVLHIDDGSYIEFSEVTYTYNFEWTEEQFKNNFIEHVKQHIRKPFEIEDIYFPLRYLNLKDIMKILKSYEYSK